MTTFRPGTLAASRSVSSSVLYSAASSPATALRSPKIASLRSLRERRRAGQVAAEGVDGHRIGAVQPADEIGDGVGGVHEAPVHVVAGVEQHEHVGADERVRVALQARRRVFRGSLAGLASSGRVAAVREDLQGRLAALGERGDLLRDAVLEDAEIARLEPRDVPPLAVGDGEAQHHHVHFDPEHRAGPLLRAEPHRSGNSQKYG